MRSLTKRRRKVRRALPRLRQWDGRRYVGTAKKREHFIPRSALSLMNYRTPTKLNTMSQREARRMRRGWRPSLLGAVSPRPLIKGTSVGELTSPGPHTKLIMADFRNT